MTHRHWVLCNLYFQQLPMVIKLEILKQLYLSSHAILFIQNNVLEKIQINLKYYLLFYISLLLKCSFLLMCLWWKTVSDWNTSVFAPSHWFLCNLVCQQCNVCKQSVIFSVSGIFSRVLHPLCLLKQQLTQLSNEMLLIFGDTNEWSSSIIGLEKGRQWIKSVNKLLWNFVGVVR